MINSGRRRGRPSTQTQLDKESLLEIALTKFAEHGYNGLKLSALAKDAGIANSLINYYFESKEDLWKQSLLFGFSKLEAKFSDVIKNFKDIEGIQLLKVLTRQLVYFNAEMPEFFMAHYREMQADRERARWIYKNLFSPLEEKVKKTLANAQEQKIIKPFPLHVYSMIVSGAVNMFFASGYFLKKEYGKDPFDEEAIEEYADHMIDIIFNGVKLK